MTQLAVAGTESFTLGFRLAGIRKIWTAEGDALAGAVREAMADEDVSILVMDTASVQTLEPRLRDKIATSVRPTLVAVGMEEDNTLREKIKQAVGVDLW